MLDDVDLKLEININITVASNGRVHAPKPRQELHAFCVIRAYYTQSTGLWVTQRQSTIHKTCIFVEQTMQWKFSRPIPRERL